MPDPNAPERVWGYDIGTGTEAFYGADESPEGDDPLGVEYIRADLASEREREAFQEGWERKDCAAFQDFEHAYAAYQQRKGER